ncbi:MAG: DUF1003 domain-containing protein [Actinomycetota bacterium]
MDDRSHRSPNQHPVNRRHHDGRSTGEAVADGVARRVGSWPFIIGQSSLLLGWLLYNAYIALHLLQRRPFDPFPFILLNLALSFQAAYTGPIVMMSQNRQAQKDRDMAEHDYHVNQRAFEHLIWQNDQLLQLLGAAGLRPTAASPSASVE